MKQIKILFAAILFLSCQFISGQSNNPWEKWNFLIGEWVGEHNGQAGQGEGKFSFQTDLNSNILVRKSHTVLPATSSSSEIIHDDLLIVYPSSESQEAIYFDNEGHTIKYRVSFTDNSVILLSDKSPSAMRFRFTYSKIDANTVNATFEMATPQAPDDFKMYLSGKAIKVN